MSVSAPGAVHERAAVSITGPAAVRMLRNAS